MQYFKVNEDIYLGYDAINKTASVISKKLLQSVIDKMIKELPPTPTDAELLKWAKINYPGLSSIDDQKKRIKEKQDELKELDKIPLAK